MAKTLAPDGTSFVNDEMSEREDVRESETKARYSKKFNDSCSSGENFTSGKHSGKRSRRKKSGVDAGKRSSRKTNVKKDGLCKHNNRSRRLVANARERSRIHILSDAFENLRKAVPSYSQDQKLSKLAILKLATYYISALANLAEGDTSTRSLRKFSDCVSLCTKALQTEGRARRKQY